MPLSVRFSMVNMLKWVLDLGLTVLMSALENAHADLIRRIRTWNVRSLRLALREAMRAVP
ncbi:hypothetical protein ACIRG8_26050 [Streptomyces sp. NPDC102359]|uniref:hypothetical protein n=1 Tax=unclassified Streptomyces TaxID=2593676 RepID=UPI0038000B43